MLRVLYLGIVFLIVVTSAVFSEELTVSPVVLSQNLEVPTQNKDFMQTKLMPLNIAIKGAVIPSLKFSDGSSFAQSKKFITELNYRWHDSMSIGAGFSFYSRNPKLIDSNRQYKYRELFVITTWYPNYHANMFNVYYGLKANIYLLLWESSGDLDSGDESSSNVGLEPFLGVLVPIKDHIFIDLSVSYHIRTIPKLYHQSESTRETNVSDSHLLVSAGLRF